MTEQGPDTEHMEPGRLSLTDVYHVGTCTRQLSQSTGRQTLCNQFSDRELSDQLVRKAKPDAVYIVCEEQTTLF